MLFEKSFLYTENVRNLLLQQVMKGECRILREFH